jgi:para-nitrobenzyl esterase
VCETSVSDAVAAGVGADKAVLMGATAHEFTMMLLPSADALEGLDPAPLLIGAGASPELALTFVEHSRTSGDLERGTAWVVGQAVTDVIFRAPVAHWAGLRAGGPGGTWVYDFRWESRSPDVAGAAHCVDIPFGMDMLSAEGVPEALGGDPPQELADAVHADWLRLIRDGEVAAPQHAQARATIIYGADASRTVGDGYELEARIWDEIAGAS